MKALPLLKLLLMITLAACMHVMAAPAHAKSEIIADTSNAEMAKAPGSFSVPETSSVVLIGALGLMLMLRRRRLHA